MQALAKLQELNEKFALNITLVIGTMWCTYAFVIFCLLPLLTPQWEVTLLYISNCLQLVFLPLIMVGQAVLNRRSEQRAQEDHENILKEFLEIKLVHEEMISLLKKKECKCS